MVVSKSERFCEMIPATRFPSHPPIGTGIREVSMSSLEWGENFRTFVRPDPVAMRQKWSPRLSDLKKRPCLTVPYTATAVNTAVQLSPLRKETSGSHRISERTVSELRLSRTVLRERRTPWPSWGPHCVVDPNGSTTLPFPGMVATRIVQQHRRTARGYIYILPTRPVQVARRPPRHWGPVHTIERHCDYTPDPLRGTLANPIKRP